MSLASVVIWLVIGAIAGWLAGEIVKGHGFGLAGNIVIGIVGAMVAGWIFPRLHVGMGNGILSHIIFAAVGAVILLILAGIVRKL